MFNIFRKRKPEPAPEPPPALGWQAIEAAFERAYPGQKPKHWAHGGVRRMHDLNTPPENPLDGVSVYDGGTFWHYVSFGMSDLYEKVSQNELSGFGFELTLRAAKRANEAEPPLWPINLLVNLGRAAFAGHAFDAGHTIKTGPIDGNSGNPLTAVIIAPDPAFEVLETPYGKVVTLLQLVGVEGAVRERALAVGSQPILEELRAKDPRLVTALPT